MSTPRVSRCRHQQAGRRSCREGTTGAQEGLPILEAALSYVLEKMASNGRRQTRNRISLSLSH